MTIITRPSAEVGPASEPTHAVEDGRRLVIPDYGGACTAGIVPALLNEPDELPAWMPDELAGARQVVVLVVDGLGWNQMHANRRAARHLLELRGRSVTTVAPTTTATALTSITTGVPPGEHGVVGYRIAVGGEILNVLRWATPRGDARNRVPPHEFAPIEPFEAQRPPVVSRAEFDASGFTGAHLRGARYVGYRMASTLAVEVIRLLDRGEPFVYAYHDGLDKVGHEYGVGEHYEAELSAVDLLVARLVERLPADAALVVTADHGMIEVPTMLRIAPELMAATSMMSGEARFRWLHAEDGAADDLLATARALYGDCAWVMSGDELVEEGWFGPRVTDAARSRLGDVALVPFEPVGFDDPADTGPYILVGRHGSMTADEVLVPFLVHRAT